jgi:hypothetical protein
MRAFAGGFHFHRAWRAFRCVLGVFVGMSAQDDVREALEAAQLAAAADDYDSLEKAGLELVGLARRRRHEDD